MGKRIDRVTFDEADFAQFRERLGQCLAALGELLDRPGFGVGPTTIGAELELTERIAGYEWDLTQVRELLRELSQAMRPELDALRDLDSAA
jgi:hypothetical protein